MPLHRLTLQRYCLLRMHHQYTNTNLTRHSAVLVHQQALQCGLHKDALTQHVLQALQSLVSDLLGQDIGMEEPLMEAGLDSIGAVELRNSVASKYGIDLPATISFDQPTVRALADYMAAMLAPQRRTEVRTDVGSFELVSLLLVTLTGPAKDC